VSYSTEHIRNMALAGHAGTGKTTLFEALLHAGGALASPGQVERGTTVSDTDAQERTRGHSIDSAIAAIALPDYRVTMIDTPGYAEFRGQALAALDAVETVVIVVDAVRGIEHGTRRFFSHARERGLATMIAINRIDAEHADPAGVLAALREAFGPGVLAINLPTAHGTAVVDCFFHDDGDSDFSSPTHAHRQLLDQVMEIDEATMEHYLEDGEAALTPAELHDAFEQCLREGHVVPVCFTSARSGVGVGALLDIVGRLLPNPAEGNPPPFVRSHAGGDTAVHVVPDPDRHVVADVFKVVNDPFLGKLGVFRLYQGTIRKDGQLFVDDGRKLIRVAHLYRLQGKEHVPIDEALPGDIAVVGKVEEVHFHAVLHDAHEDDRLHLVAHAYPQPMFALAIEPAHKGHEQKLSTGLARLAGEDPCFRVEHRLEANETVVHGLSDLHVRLMLERLQLRSGVDVIVHPPRIAYRETITSTADGHARHKKQTGGAGQFGEVALRVEPLPRGAGFEFVDATRGGVIPGQFIPAIEKGIRHALEQGAIAGYPLQDLRVVITDGKHHPVDSKEVAFFSAGRKAFIDAVVNARPQLLEPIVDLQVDLPAGHVGDVTGSLAARRAHILGTAAIAGGELSIHAKVPLAELEDYALALKSLTAGQGRYALDFSHYEAVPAATQRKLVDAYSPHREAG
jgi:elongation factor G